MRLNFALSPLFGAAVLVTTTHAVALGIVVGPPHQDPAITRVEVALAVGPDTTTTWATVEVRSVTEGFAWIVPLPPGARVVNSTDGWLEALDVATAPVVYPPPERPPCGDVVFTKNSETLARAPRRPALTTSVAADGPALLAAIQTAGFVAPTSLEEDSASVFSSGGTVLVATYGPGDHTATTSTVRVTAKGAPQITLGASAEQIAVTAYVLGSARAFAGALAISPDDIAWHANGSTTYAEALAGAASRGWVTQSAARGVGMRLPESNERDVVAATMPLDATWITRAALARAPSSGPSVTNVDVAGDVSVDPSIVAGAYDVTCDPGTPLASPGNAGGGSPAPPATDPTDDAKRAAAAEACAFAVGDACSSSSSGDDESSSSGCSSSSSGQESSSSESSSSSDDSGCSSSSSKDDSNDCSAARRRGRSPVSRLTLVGAALALFLRRRARSTLVAAAVQRGASSSAGAGRGG